jgi:hypothetical protein
LAFFSKGGHATASACGTSATQELPCHKQVTLNGTAYPGDITRVHGVQHIILGVDQLVVCGGVIKRAGQKGASLIHTVAISAIQFTC